LLVAESNSSHMRKKNNHILSICLLLLCYLFFFACAKIVAPTGGPKDVTPPGLIPEKSDSSMQTNFKQRSFELTFDEWVKLDNVSKQVVVTPPLQYTPDVKLKKRTVIFSFDEKEVLRDSATYVINFGDAIKDLNESIPAKNMRFVFSTGDYIDSLSVEGKVIDAFSGEPVKDVTVMLYDNLSDSVVYKERPFYLSKTSESGTFKIENIRADTFKVFALADKNFNYLFDMPSEQIGYQSEQFILNDSVKINLILELFEEEKALRLVDKIADRYGKLTLIFNKPPDEKLQVTFDPVLQRQHKVYEQDSIHLWYQPKDSVNWSVYLQQDTLLYDTVKVKAGSRAAFFAKAKIKLNPKVRSKLEKHNRTQAMLLEFNHPIAALDSNAFVLLEDTTLTSVKPMLQFSVDTPMVVRLQYRWKENVKYQLILTPGAVTDWYGVKNDSIPLSFTIPSLETFGNMNLQLSGLKKELFYIVELYKGKELVNTRSINADSILTIPYNGLPPAVAPEPLYNIRVIVDADGNGRWSPGNYTMKTQSEMLYFRELGELRANWDVNYEVSLDEKNIKVMAPEGETNPELSKGKQ
jgi:Bacterial Ig-like domain